jgi:hypothetical protein
MLDNGCICWIGPDGDGGGGDEWWGPSRPKNFVLKPSELSTGKSTTVDIPPLFGDTLLPTPADTLSVGGTITQNGGPRKKKFSLQ